MLTPERLALARSFVEVAEARSFRVAARALRISGSTLSRRVQALEEELAVQLLYRTTRKVSLTPAGERYLESCRAGLAAIEAAEAELTGITALPRGRLKVSAPIAFGRLWLGPMVPRLLALYPELELELHLQDELVNLVEGKIDLAVRLGKLDDSALIGRRLASVGRVLVAAPAYLRKYGTPKRIEELARHRCLHFTPYPTGEQWHLREGGRHKHVRVSGPLRTNHLETLLEAVRAGAGIALLGTLIVAPLIASGELTQLLPKVQGPAGDVWLVHLPGAERKAAVRATRDFLSESIRELLPQAPGARTRA